MELAIARKQRSGLTCWKREKRDMRIKHEIVAGVFNEMKIKERQKERESESESRLCFVSSVF